jgi:hypothetical protein
MMAAAMTHASAVQGAPIGKSEVYLAQFNACGVYIIFS